jgi:hypothetical protein
MALLSVKSWAMTAKTARLVQNQRRRVSYVACRGGHNSRPGTTEAGEPAKYRGASKSATMVGVEEATGAKPMSLSE